MLDFLSILIQFFVYGRLWGEQKMSENPHNHMKLNLCQLISVGETLQFEYNFGTWQISEKNAAVLNIFLYHMKYE